MRERKDFIMTTREMKRRIRYIRKGHKLASRRIDADLRYTLLLYKIESR
jgi:hypothetical protein